MTTPQRYDASMHLPTAVRTTTVEERTAAGRAARTRRPRTSLGEWSPPANRPDPVDLLGQQETARIQALLPLRHERMSASAFAFYRGAAAIMADDLGTMPNTGIVTQLCGDAHLVNFGVFGAPDRTLVFDINDFDETHPGPFEWDVLRLAASFVLAGRDNGMPTAVADAALAVGNAYRTQIQAYAAMDDLAIWYDRIVFQDVLELAQQEGLARQKQLAKAADKARTRTAWSAIAKMTQLVDGQRQFLNLPPLLMRAPLEGVVRDSVEEVLAEYRDTLPHDRRTLLRKYHVIDVAHKVVGVGSVGLLAFVALMQGRDEDDLIVLQAKQAVHSVLEPFTAPSLYPQSGERVVAGQQLMQAASDIFLGWTQGGAGRQFYVRQLRDMKYAVDLTTFDAKVLRAYAVLCGRTLARAHARAGDAVAIAGYLGDSDKFDKAVQSFALAYGDQADADFAAYKAAIAAGRISLGSHAEEAHYEVVIDPVSGVDVVVTPPDAAAATAAPSSDASAPATGPASS